jgi:EAL domain-containing protein (putative c-di-GMP-specific phosphodiesterase class I)
MDLRITASIGVSRWPGDGDDAAGLQRAADRALTAGRRDGRHQLRFYERSLDERTRTGLALDRDLRLAAAQRGLEVHYQPIIDLRTGEVAAAEALVRWHHPEHGPIPPSVFIPTAEATGTISAISDLVMTTVAENLAGWNSSGLLPDGARIAVNISATEFGRRGFVERISATLKDAGVSPSQIELEITETLLMSDLETTASRLTELDELGFLVALDDFGTGYSSLSYLHSLPLHTLKVDRCFVGDLRDGRSETITRAILSLAHGLGIIAVGEGVETEEQRRFLIDAGCDLVQGYFYSPPLPRPAFETFLREHGQQADLDVDLQRT